MTSNSRKPKEWVENYKRGREKSLYLSGGVGALFVVGGLTDRSFSAAPYPMQAVFILLAVLAGGFLALAVILYESASDTLNRKMSVPGMNQDLDIDKDAAGYPIAASPCMILGFALMGCAAIVLVVAAFFRTSPECTVKLQTDHDKMICTTG